MNRTSDSAKGEPGMIAKSGIYRTMMLMGFSALTVSAATIIAFNQFVDQSAIASFNSHIALSVTTLMPYMISAVVAAITAIAIMKIFPMAEQPVSLQQIRDRIGALSDGDLATHLRIHTQDETMKSIANELNFAVGQIGHQIALWKVINRQQWELLNCVHSAGKRDDGEAVCRYVEQIEENWKRIAEIEAKLTT
jgi:methyl-accepting chemotaxis protein